MRNAYNCTNLIEFLCKFSFDREAASLTICDNFKLKDRASITERFVTFVEPQADGDDAILQVNGTAFVSRVMAQMPI